MMKFVATEAGFIDGLGGASNSNSEEDYHYIIFGYQEDSRQPSNSGIYFEYDDQGNSSINEVEHVVVSKQSVSFSLANDEKIAVLNDVTEQQWNEFLDGIQTVFSKQIRKST